MAFSPRRKSAPGTVRPWLYRKPLAGVILAVVSGFIAMSIPSHFLHAQELTQTYKRKQAEKGPRAIGLVQLSTTGKARIIPLVIMVDGKFYDATSYKATPVPMALDFGVVYEGFRSGVSQGLFTITQPGQLNHNWIAEGTWLPAGTKPKETAKKYSPPVIDEDSRDDRPKLHRRAEGKADDEPSKSTPSSGTDSSGTKTPASTPSAGSGAPASTAPASSPSGTSTSGSSAPSAPPATASGGAPSSPAKDSGKDAAKPPAASRSDLDQPISDPNRPILRRGKPNPNEHHEPFVDFDAVDDAAKKSAAAAQKGDATVQPPSVQTVTAISDAAGPDPRPYTYDLKPAEESIYRNKMLDLAGTLLKVGPRQSAAAPASSASTKAAPARAKALAAKAKPQFDEVNLRIFDLSNSNEPVLVLSARTPLPPAGASGSHEPQEITLVARTNLEGELQKLFFAQTDANHLDVSPRMELVDAVDADGDGRGELLFRQTSDAGSGYAIYRVTADQLYPLYVGTP